MPDLNSVHINKSISEEFKEWDSSYINNLPDSAFAAISAGGNLDDEKKTVPRELRHLPYQDAQGNIDVAHTRNALVRLEQTDISADQKAEAKKELESALASVNKEKMGEGEAIEAKDKMITLNPPIEIEIFKTGNYGEKGNYTQQDIQQIAKDYTPEIHEAPITVDHRQDGASLGWVDGLKCKGDMLIASVSKIASGLYDALKSGKLKKRSVEIYDKFKDTGGKYLRALTFLGAQVPEVKGLQDLQFKDDSKFTTINFSEVSQMDKTTFNKIIDALKKVFGMSIENESEGSDSITQDAECCSECKKKMAECKCADGAKGKEDKPDTPPIEDGKKIDKGGNETMSNKTFSEDEMKSALEKAEADKTQAVKDAQEKVRQEFVETQKKESETKSFMEFCEVQCKSGKMTPAMKAAIIPIATTLIKDEKTIKFGEGAEAKDKSVLGALKDFLADLPTIIAFGEELVAKQKAMTSSENILPGATLESVELNARAESIQKEKGISFAEALIESQRLSMPLK